MLTIQVSLGEDLFNSETQQFVKNEIVLQLEHSLASLSKWESFFEKPFLGKEKKTTEETLWYIRAMTTNNVPPEVYDNISDANINKITEYIGANMTATWVNERPTRRPSTQVITSELVYYWMIMLGIPFECQHWHLSRLLTLIKVCSVQNAPKTKMNRKEAAEMRRQLNEERKTRYNTKG